MTEPEDLEEDLFADLYVSSVSRKLALLAARLHQVY